MLNAIGKIFKKERPLDTFVSKGKRFTLITPEKLPNSLLDAVTHFLNAPDVWNLGFVNKDLNTRIHKLTHTHNGIQHDSRFLALYISRMLNQGPVTPEMHEELLDIQSKYKTLVCISNYACSYFDFNLSSSRMQLNCLKARVDNDQLSFLTECKNLTSLNLEGSELTDEGLMHLSVLTALQNLSLDGCAEITDKGIVNLSVLALRDLNLSRCQITDKGLNALSSLKLNSLNLWGCTAFTEGGLQALGKMPLHTLKLPSLEKITDEGFQHLRGLTALTELCALSLEDATAPYLPHFIHLKKLTVCQITDEGLGFLTQCAHLEEIDCARDEVTHLSPRITDKGLITLTACAQLKILTFEMCHEITEVGIKELTQLTLLKKIKILDCDKLKHLGMLDSLNASRALQEVCFFEPYRIKIARPSSHFLQLQKLACRSSEIRSLSKLTNLHTLEIDSRNSDDITKKDVKSLAALPHLHTLTLRCKNTADTLEHINRLSHLHTLNLAYINPHNIKACLKKLLSFDSIQTLIVSPCVDLATKKKLRVRFEVKVLHV